MKSPVIHQAQEVSEDVVRRVIASLGFPPDRVERAVACLLASGSTPAGSIGRVLSFKEVQYLLGISKSGLRRIMAAGALTPIEITKRRIGFLADNVSEFIQGRKHWRPARVVHSRPLDIVRK